MLTITKPILGLLFMAAAAFGEPASTACGSTLFDNYADADFTVASKTEARSMLASVKSKFKAIKVEYRAAKQNLRKLGREAKDEATEEVTPPTQPSTEPPAPGPTTNPSPGQSTNPTPPPTQLTYTASDGNFLIDESHNCTARVEELQKYFYVAGNLTIDRAICTSIELNLLKGVGGHLVINQGQLTSFSANQLQTIGDQLFIRQVGQLTSFNANQLQTIATFVFVYQNTELDTLGLPALAQIGANGGAVAVDIVANKNTSLCSTAIQSACTHTCSVRACQ